MKYNRLISILAPSKIIDTKEIYLLLLITTFLLPISLSIQKTTYSYNNIHYNSLNYVSNEVKDGIIPHTPIAIDGNEDFLAQALNESWSGNGTWANPIIIQNYNITSSETEHMITIWNTDVSFIIQGCILNGVDGLSKTFGDGIWLNSVKNGIIRDNKIFSNKMGISLEPNNEDLLIEGNSIYNNSASGIHSHQSTNISIIQNDIFKNIQGGSDPVSLGDGIEMSESSDILILENEINDNDHYGITIRSSQSVNCSRNVISSNSMGIGLLTDSEINVFTFNIFENNTDYALILSTSSSNNLIKYNDFINNSVNNPSQAQDYGNYNLFVFNYYNEWEEPDSNNDTIVDAGYSIDGFKNNVDRYPFTISVFEVNNIKLFTTTPVSSSEPTETTDSVISFTTTTSSSTDLSFESFFCSILLFMAFYSLYKRKNYL